MSETTAPELPQSGAHACPHCGAARAAGVGWCTQCFAVLDAPVASTTPVRQSPTGAADPAAATDLEFELSAWDLAQQEAAQANAGAEASLPDPELELAGAVQTGNPLLRQLMAMGGTPAGKVVIMVGGTVALVTILMGGMALIGLLL